MALTSTSKAAAPAAPGPMKSIEAESAHRKAPGPWVAGPISLPAAGFALQGLRLHTPGPTIQTKLTVSQPDDPLEREAEAVADQIMTSPAPPAAGDEPVISRMATPDVQRMCADCEEEEASR